MSLTVTDNENAEGTTSKDVTVSDVVSGITLTVNGSKDRGTKYVDLFWSGSDGNGDVTVFRNGSVAYTTPDDGEDTDNLGKGGGTYTYKICETVSGPCSNEATWVF